MPEELEIDEYDETLALEPTEEKPGKPTKARISPKEVKNALREMGVNFVTVKGIKATSTVGQFLHESGIMYYAGGILTMVQEQAGKQIQMCDEYLAKQLDPESMVSIMKIRAASVECLAQTAQSHLNAAKIKMTNKDAIPAPNACFPPPPPPGGTSNVFNGPVQVIQKAENGEKD